MNKIIGNDKPLKTINSTKIFIGSGLANLGNTCFINSILQCLFHTELFVWYFLNNNEDTKINNLEGEKMQIAKNLLGLYEVYTNNPVSLKTTLECFRLSFVHVYPQFDSFKPQDANEFLSYLLDNLNCQFRKVTVTNTNSKSEISNSKKNFVAKVSSINPLTLVQDKTPDNDNAIIHSIQEFNQKKRKGDSIIMDIFFGLFYTTISCIHCEKIVTVNELFSVLQLGIPKKRLSIQIQFFKLNKTTPKLILLTIFEKTALKTLKNRIVEDNPFLVSINQIEAFAYTSNKFSMTKITNNYEYIWGYYMQKQQILFYETIIEGNIIFCIPNNLSLPFSIHLNSLDILVNELSIQISNILALPKDDNKINISLIRKTQKQIFLDPLDLNKSISFFFKDIPPPFFIHIKLSKNQDITTFGQSDWNTIEISGFLGLNECLEFYTMASMLEGWYCPTCQKKVDAEKRMKIAIPPRVLIIQFKRLNQKMTFMGSLKVVKDQTMITFEETLNIISSTVGNRNVQYELYAVVYHTTVLSFGGHYFTACKVDDKWYEYNDKRKPREMDAKEVINSNAYLLFYNLKKS